MEISRKMNLVTPVETANGNIYIHSTPITKAVYREHFLTLSKAFAAIFGHGLGVLAGPRIAYLMLERVAKNDGIWEGATGVKNTLLQEIIRNSTAIVPVDGKGWEEIPLDVAISREVVDEDDVLGEIVFFTCVCAINKPGQATALMEQVNSLWNSVCTSQSSMEWAASLPTLTDKESSGETESTLSVPS
ncbi:hypothetical protein [Serratia oryzae]|uniref:Uncharacterized protein n=1 Tax=Serratia oryzae TaxID=2034155 RepID=A0A1S8CR30_9GAMM|nr:hypothetical protein [Serratia oryzae]OMQ26908.1 hypothetical protein BMI79_00850 [Serratia oryzae]